MPKVIGVKLPDDVLGRFQRAAGSSGHATVAGWLRWLGDRETAPPAPNEDHYYQPSHNNVIVQHSVTTNNTSRKLTAAEIAAMIPGVQVGVGAEPMEMGPEWVEAVEERDALPIFDWRGRFARWKARGDAGEEEKREYLQDMALPVQFWQKKNEAAWILWLEENRPNG